MNRKEILGHVRTTIFIIGITVIGSGAIVYTAALITEISSLAHGSVVEPDNEIYPMAPAVMDFFEANPQYGNPGELDWRGAMPDWEKGGRFWARTKEGTFVFYFEKSEIVKIRANFNKTGVTKEYCPK